VRSLPIPPALPRGRRVKKGKSKGTVVSPGLKGAYLHPEAEPVGGETAGAGSYQTVEINSRRSSSPFL